MGVASYPEEWAANSLGLMDAAWKVLNKAKADGGHKVYAASDAAEEKKADILEGSRDVKYLWERSAQISESSQNGVRDVVFEKAKGLGGTEDMMLRTKRLAEALGVPGLEAEVIRQAALVRDLGKLVLSEEVLNKPSALSPKELGEIRNHPQLGVEILKPIKIFKEMIPLVLHHHEKWNGTGYPFHLKGEKIPLGARIIAVADTYEALISDRPYRKAYPKEEALKIINQESGVSFDPVVVDEFMKIVSNPA